jgi:hypothetical protein
MHGQELPKFMCSRQLGYKMMGHNAETYGMSLQKFVSIFKKGREELNFIIKSHSYEILKGNTKHRYIGTEGNTNEVVKEKISGKEADTFGMCSMEKMILFISNR